MSTLKVIRGIKIKMYAGDHPPPHVHIRAPGFDCVVNLQTLKVKVRGNKTCDAQAAIDWITDNQELLLTEWERLNG
ncbi:conserved hypothetical protein [Magnetococcus marinus MC-1]|uniref:DUF4160 domain-containing protein n=1 Tax=Magnetococcus marinus (strain ATCC BAA-1437 / JCM 17883 / MC-1) TaxID=156889 RepID=A0L993_MAGMM|nr:DUF4160 domain-containing protein [Magnetococcus marinus]ABK44536.1 conserved hypothetical protein [Magnetococcus marinus MC-1]